MKTFYDGWRKFLSEAKKQEFIDQFEDLLGDWDSLQGEYGEIPDYSYSPEGERIGNWTPQRPPINKMPNWAKNKNYSSLTGDPNTRRAYYSQTKQEVEIEKKLLRLYQKHADQDFFKNEITLSHDLNYPAAAHPLFDDYLEFEDSKTARESYLTQGGKIIKNVMSCVGHYGSDLPSSGYGVFLSGWVVFAARTDLASQTLRTAHKKVKQFYSSSGLPKRAGLDRVHLNPRLAKWKLKAATRKRERDITAGKSQSPLTQEEINNIKNSVVLDAGDMNGKRIAEVLVANSVITGFWSVGNSDGIMAEKYFRKGADLDTEQPFYLISRDGMKKFNSMQEYFKVRDSYK